MRSELPHLLRSLLAAVLLLALAGWQGPRVLPLLLPPAQAWMAWIEPSFTVLKLEAQTRPEGARVRLQAALARPVVVGDTVVMPHPRGRAWAQVPAAQVWQAPVLLVAVLLAWPVVAVLREWVARLLLGLPVLAVVLLLDTPLVLLAEIWKLLLESDPRSAPRPLVLWSDILRMGGRPGGALLAAAAVVHFSRSALGPRGAARPAAVPRRVLSPPAS